jgi:hypothetical protein
MNDTVSFIRSEGEKAKESARKAFGRELEALRAYHAGNRTDELGARLDKASRATIRAFRRVRGIFGPKARDAFYVEVTTEFGGKNGTYPPYLPGTY